MPTIYKMKVISFGSAEEMIEHLDKIQQSAKESYELCTEGQKNLKEGDFFITEAHGLIIFNEAIEMDAKDTKEFEYAKSLGYIMVKAWSNACKDGELGSVHKSRAIAKLVDSDKHTTGFVFSFIISIWEDGGEIDKYDMQWIRDTKNLEVLT
jgi:hypothetical protein